MSIMIIKFLKKQSWPLIACLILAGLVNIFIVPAAPGAA
jgi:hypothetical protein